MVAGSVWLAIVPSWSRSSFSISSLTELLRSSALPTSVRGARMPRAGSMVISSTVCVAVWDSDLAGWSLGRFRLAIWRP
jgi:hypothetical protein